MPFDALNPPADIDPDASARCPLRLLGDGPRCRALVLVKDARDHASWHEALDDALRSPVTVETALHVAPWPADPEVPDDTAPGPSL